MLVKSCIAALSVSAAVFLAGSLKAQEFDIAMTAGHSANKEVRWPIGYAVGVAVLPVPYAGIRVSYGRQWSRSSSEGTTCASYWPAYTDCRDEELRSNSELSVASAGVLMRSPEFAGWTIEMEISRSRSKVRDLTITGQQTGRVRQAHVPSYEQLGRFEPNGWGKRFGLRKKSILGASLDAQLSYASRSSTHRGCATDTYVPFCENLVISEAQLSIVYRP